VVPEARSGTTRISYAPAAVMDADGGGSPL
jgi:hypothetical protein